MIFSSRGIAVIALTGLAVALPACGGSSSPTEPITPAPANPSDTTAAATATTTAETTTKTTAATATTTATTARIVARRTERCSFIRWITLFSPEIARRIAERCGGGGGGGAAAAAGAGSAIVDASSWIRVLPISSVSPGFSSAGCSSRRPFRRVPLLDPRSPTSIAPLAVSIR